MSQPQNQQGQQPAQQPQQQPQQNGQHAGGHDPQQATSQQAQLMGLEHAMRQAEQIRSDLLDQISDSDLNSDARNLLENLVSKDFIFANLTQEEVTEFKFELMLFRKKFYTLHPSQESVIEGEFRRYVYDDEGNTLTSLTQQEKLIVDQFFKGVFQRVTRAREMKQQEILRTQIQQSVTGDLGGDSDSGGLLGRWRD